MNIQRIERVQSIVRFRHSGIVSRITLVNGDTYELGTGESLAEYGNQAKVGAKIAETINMARLLNEREVDVDKLAEAGFVRVIR